MCWRDVGAKGQCHPYGKKKLLLFFSLRITMRLFQNWDLKQFLGKIPHWESRTSSKIKILGKTSLEIFIEVFNEDFFSLRISSVNRQEQFSARAPSNMNAWIRHNIMHSSCCMYEIRIICKNNENEHDFTITAYKIANARTSHCMQKGGLGLKKNWKKNWKKKIEKKNKKKNLKKK